MSQISTDIHDSTGTSFHSVLLMAPKKQLLQLLQAHVHILHCVCNLSSANTHIGGCVIQVIHLTVLFVALHFPWLRPPVSTYLSRAGLLLLLSSMEPTEPLPSRTDWTIATGRTGGSEEHTSHGEVNATASPPGTLLPFPPPRTPGLTGSSLISIMHFSLQAESHTVC